MAQFYGSVKGSRGETTRLGGKESGMRIYGQGYNIGCFIKLRYDPSSDQDIVEVWLTGGTNGSSDKDKLIGIYKEKEAWT